MNELAFTGGPHLPKTVIDTGLLSDAQLEHFHFCWNRTISPGRDP
jgi:hypothetical protein